jgi:hypothetical protein
MTICFVAEKGYLAYGAAIRDEVERERSGFLSIFLLETPPSYEAWLPPRADLYLLPASFFLDLKPEARPEPLFAYGSEELILEAMDSGCADYLREPLDGTEIEARVRKLFSFRLRLGDIALSCSAERRLSSDQGQASLTEAEFRLFRILALNLNRPVPRAALDYALKGKRCPRSRSLDVHVASIRKKLELFAPGTGAALRSVRGAGYILLGTACA